MPLTVNGERVEDEVIEREVQSLRRHFEQMTPEQREAQGLDPVEMEKRWWDWARENVIERTLLRQEAQKDTEPIPAEAVEKALEKIKQRHGGEDRFQLTHASGEAIRDDIETRIRLDRLIGKITQKVGVPKNKEIAEFYRKNKDRFRLPEMVRAAHIVKHVNEQTDEETARAAIETVEEELRQGAKFEELTDKYSDCPGNGGDLGYFPRGEMVEEFDEVVFALDVGEVSPIFRTVFGFHIAKVLDKKAAAVRTLAEASDEIKQEIRRLKETRAIEDYVDRLKAGAEIHDLVSAPG